MKFLVSACLLGACCRYDGQSKPNDAVLRLAQQHECVPFCPEIYGGLPTPRTPAERQAARVITRDGLDVTDAYARGAREALRMACTLCCDAAVLQDHSPSCGKGSIHNGCFDGGLCAGNGVTTDLLQANGIPVYAASEVETLKL